MMKGKEETSTKVRCRKGSSWDLPTASSLVNLERGRDKMKKQEQRAVEKKLVTRSLIWLILLGEINFNTKTS